MKRIIAMIRPVFRDEVIAALHKVENFPGAVFTKVSSIRRGVNQDNDTLKEELDLGFQTYLRIEIICSDQMVPVLVEAISANAHSGKGGDGKIFTSEIDSVLRISDGKLDIEAL